MAAATLPIGRLLGHLSRTNSLMGEHVNSRLTVVSMTAVVAALSALNVLLLGQQIS